MGFYIRKSFSSGPVRLNLSKSGLGFSVGIKGLRLSSGPRGNYIHGGRGGLYFRKKLSNNTKYRSTTRYASTSQDQTDYLGIVAIIGGIIALVIFINAVTWLINNPAILIFTMIVASLITGFLIYKNVSKSKAIKEYKKTLDEIFLQGTSEFSKEKLMGIKEILINNNCKAETEKIEKNIYNTVLDKIIDDNEITPAEKKVIQNLETIISLDDSYKKARKVEIFKAYYLNAIEDRLITESEINTLNNIAEGFEIDKSVVQNEMQTVQDIIKMQSLKHPIPALESVPITIQKSETAFYSSMGKVLSKKKAPKNSGSEYEYNVKREGNLVITDKRILVVKEGTTSISIADILDVDVDIDNKHIVISKGKSVTPTILQTDEALFCGKMINIIRSNMAEKVI